MSAFLRSASPALIAALAAGQIHFSADLLTITLVDGTTVFRWTNFDRDLKAAGVPFSAKGTFLAPITWKATNTMEVPETGIKLSSLNRGFNGGAALQAQINAGLLDGATFLVQMALMGADANPDTLGVVAVAAGKIGAIDCDGVTASITGKGKINDLDQYVPRNLYQVTCNRAFCDTGCTLSRATYTQAYTMGATPSTTLIPWAAVPGTPALYQGGTLAVTSGAASGARRTIVQANSSGLLLAYPLASLPAAGDTFTAFQGCDRAQNSGSGQSCADRSNTANFKGTPYVPQPSAAY